MWYNYRGQVSDVIRVVESTAPALVAFGVTFPELQAVKTSKLRET
jgi:hypothetical protein